MEDRCRLLNYASRQFLFSIPFLLFLYNSALFVTYNASLFVINLLIAITFYITLKGHDSFHLAADDSTGYNIVINTQWTPKTSSK